MPHFLLSTALLAAVAKALPDNPTGMAASSLVGLATRKNPGFSDNDNRAIQVDISKEKKGLPPVTMATSASFAPKVPTRVIVPSSNPTLLQRWTKIAMRVLHPSLVSSYCVAREIMGGSNTISKTRMVSGSEVLAMYCIHVFVFAADRLGDGSYDQDILQGIIGSTAVAFAFTADKKTLGSGLVFTGALAIYPLVKQIPYLKCFWVPLAFTVAAAVGAGQSTQYTGALFGACAFLYYLGNCSACDIIDINEDKRNGVRTLATAFGAKKTRMLSAVSTGLSALILLVHLLMKDGVGLWAESASWGCIFSTTLFTLGLLFKPECSPKDMDMLNSIPLLAKLVVQ